MNKNQDVDLLRKQIEAIFKFQFKKAIVETHTSMLIDLLLDENSMFNGEAP